MSLASFPASSPRATAPSPVADDERPLAVLRGQATRFFTLLAWAHVPIGVAVALLARNDWVGPAIVLAVTAGLLTLAAARMRDGLALRSIVAVAITVAPIVFVFAGRGGHDGFSGHEDWQIDYHMYFFAVYAMLAAYSDWRPIAIAAALTAVHHTLFDIFVPWAVFPEEGLDRVALHALVVVAECGVLFWMTVRVRALFYELGASNRRAADALAVAESAAAEARRNAEERSRAALALEETLQALREANAREAQLALERAELERSEAERASGERRALTTQLDQSVGTLHRGLRDSSDEMRRTAEAMDGSLATASRETAGIANGARAIAETIEELAASAEELAASGLELQRRVLDAASSTGSVAERIGTSWEQVESVRGAASQIGDVVRLISDVADQTNLLALNAAIEAARAGDAGRGFAVVAAEIRKLADQTSSATRRIADQIATMQSMTATAASTMTAMQEQVMDLSILSAEMSSAGEEQTRATSMIADRTRSAAREVARISSALDTIGVSHDSLAAAAQQVLSTADTVHDRARSLDERVTEFVKAIAA